MSFDPITEGFSFAGKIVDKLFPDKTQAEAAKAKISEMREAGELQVMMGQLAINLKEAESPSLLVSGWRPAVGWVGVISLALVYWPKAIVLMVVWCIQAYVSIKAGAPVPAYPDLGLTDILGLLASILGIGGMRTLEKLNNVAAK